MVVPMDPLPMGAGRVLLRLENRVRIGNRAQFRCIEDGFVVFANAQFMIFSNRTTMLGCQRPPRTATHSSGNTLRMTFLLTKPMGICLDKREQLDWPRGVHSRKPMTSRRLADKLSLVGTTSRPSKRVKHVQGKRDIEMAFLVRWILSSSKGVR